MASRRTGLFGASEDERESRLNQQRDYAAQLQEQVRIKNARAEQEKARRLQEQQQERELLMDSQQQQTQGRRTQTQQPVPSQPPPLQPQQQSQHHQHNLPHSPPRSPQRHQQQLQYSQHSNQSQDPEVQHGSAMLNGSPQKQWAYNPPPGGDVFSYPTSSYAAPTSSVAFSAGVAPAPLVATFTPGSSIFDSMLQPETASADVNNQVEALRTLRLEMETSWKQRRIALESITTKPCFILPPSPTASTRIPLSQDEKRLLDDNIDLTPRPDTPETPELTSSISGLFGNSVLIPLAKASTTHSNASPRLVTLPSPSDARSPSAARRRLAAAASAAAFVESDDSCLDSNALKHDSELLHFDQ